ncbi:MAG: alpha/beta fold hydrolase [Granulosicoccaceae bacterium]
MQIKQLLLIAPVALALHACSSDSNYNFEESAASQEAAFAAANAPGLKFDPANGVIPFPNNLLLGADGTVNAPITDDSAANPALALNQMDGFSTTAPITAGLTRAVDPTTVILGTSVRIFEVTAAATTAVTGIVEELGPTQVFVTATPSNIAILPVQPLKPKTHYMVIVTNGITDDAETPMPLAPSTSFRLAKGSTELTGPVAALEPVRQLTGAMLAAAGSQGIDVANVVMAWSFKTQSVRDVLQAVKDQVAPGALTLAPTGSTTTDFNAELPGNADVFIGTLDLPYYQSADPATALNSFWVDADGGAVNQFSPTPVSTGTQTIPVLLTLPNATSMAGGTAPASGWPITIFQHGITRNRADMIAVADALANAGRAVIAIDIPMHGLTDTTVPIHTDNTLFPNDGERTFGLDVVDNATRAPGSDGMIDDSGSHFYNLANLANSRDNLRQGVADLMVLAASLAGAQGASLDASNVTFVGHSLGAMIGITFLSYDDNISTASFATPGGGIARLLTNSPSFGPAIDAGLTAAGAAPGTPEYDQFLLIAQTAVDSADPVNNATALAATGKNIHFMTIIGDQVIPNAVATAPLSGTDPLPKLMGLPQVNGSTSGSALVRFSSGTHGSIINPVDDSDPAGGLATFLEMQQQMAVYAASMGSILQITNVDVIEAPPAQ